MGSDSVPILPKLWLFCQINAEQIFKYLNNSSWRESGLCIVLDMGAHVTQCNRAHLEVPYLCPDRQFSRRAGRTWVDALWMNVMKFICGYAFSHSDF